MKTYEVESFVKSFFIFLILLEILLAINFWYEFRVKKIELEKKIEIEMKLCAYTVQCEGLKTDFVDKGKDTEENILYKDNDFISYFALPNVKKSLMKVVYPRTKYEAHIQEIKVLLEKRFLLYSLVAALISFLFSIYALLPLHRALRLNEEFVKDILHDFNTPLTSMKINFQLFKKEIGPNPKIQRVENNIETILSLQNNLQVFLQEARTQVEYVELQTLTRERVSYFQVLYSDVAYHIDVPAVKIVTNRDAFIRILDNLLSNAGKYNKTSGEVFIVFSGTILSIKDTGKGIVEPSKVFRRYYKEQERGIGIGMHIVKKLCDEMHIGIEVKSQVHQGTEIRLDLSRIMG